MFLNQETKNFQFLSSGDHCSNEIPYHDEEDYDTNGGLVHISDSLYGPWKPLPNNTLNCFNPSAWKHDNGTLYFLCFIYGGTPNTFQLISGDNIHGPWKKISILDVNKLVSQMREKESIFFLSSNYFRFQITADGQEPCLRMPKFLWTQKITSM